MYHDFIVTIRSNISRFVIITSLITVFALLFVVTPVRTPVHAAGSIGGCPMFPANNPWNMDVTNWPVDPKSASYVSSVGPTLHLHPDFGSDFGIPFATVTNAQAPVTINYDGAEDESDPGPFPIP